VKIKISLKTSRDRAYALAVSYANTSSEAVKKAKYWIDNKLV